MAQGGYTASSEVLRVGSFPEHQQSGSATCQASQVTGMLEHANRLLGIPPAPGERKNERCMKQTHGYVSVMYVSY